MELIKSRYNKGLDPRLYFYRDVEGKEIDLIFQQGSSLFPIEIKSSKTFAASFIEGLEYFHRQAPERAKDGAIIYAGTQTQTIRNYKLLNPENCIELF